MATDDFQAAAHPKEKRAAPFSLRLSPEERAQLERDAGGLPLSAYIKTRLFGPAPKRMTRRRPATDHKALAQVLAQLGRSSLASNVNQLAKAVHIGNLPVGAETDAALQTACADIATMRAALMTALGKAGPRP